MSLSTADQISKLEAARQLVLADSTHYAQIVPGILPIIGAHADLDIRRWGTEFLAETFATPILENKAKESLSIVVLQTLKDLLEVPGEDAGVIQSVIRAAASIYGFVLRYTYVFLIISFIVDAPRLVIMRNGVRTACCKMTIYESPVLCSIS